MWQANAPIETRYSPQQYQDDAQSQQQQLYSQAMSDIGAQQAPASKGIQYPKQEESDPMSGIIKMLKGKPKPTMQAGPDSGLHMDKA